MATKARTLNKEEQTRKNANTLHEKVLEQLRERILEGKYAPGESLTESRLMSDLSVGRTPVREALRQLEVEGLVTIIPRKGATVNKASLKDVEETYAIAGTMEALAVSLAVSRMDNKTLKKLTEKIDEGKKIQAENDIRTYCKINREFHQLLVEGCGNDKLISLIENLRLLIYRFRFLSFAIPGRIESSIKEHEKILECIQEGDCEAVRQTMEEHWNDTKERLVQYLKEFSILSNL